jgi:hypothetical protein
MAQASSTTNAYWGNKRAHLRLVSDVAANDSDKTLTVPDGKIWEVLYLTASLAATADVGNRQMTVIVSDGTSSIGYCQAADVQVASATEYYNFGPYGTASESPAGYHFVPLPHYILPPGYTLRVYDSAAIAAAADDLTIYMLVAEYEDN